MFTRIVYLARVQSLAPGSWCHLKKGQEAIIYPSLGLVYELTVNSAPNLSLRYVVELGKILHRTIYI